MSGTFWLLVVGGLWLVGVGMLRVCARGLKDVDRAQSEMFAAARRARFVSSHTAPRPRVGTWTRASG
jgi:hypothetical protein